MEKEFMNIVIVGHVDHGKSTIIGRLLADTDSLPQGKLQQVKENCERHSKPFEYAFLLDALKDEQSQGITIDSARVFFKTQKRHYIIIDAPGHIEFLKNMVTGASRAEAALLVIDAQEGVQENSRRHGYMLSMLGIKQVAVLVNKMDLVSYQKETFDAIVEEYQKFLSEIGLSAKCFIPVSGREGDMVFTKGDHLNWYQGATVLEVLDQFEKEADQAEKPLRMPVQDVYKFTKYDDSRRIIAGTIETGSLKIGDDVIFYPSGKESHIKSIESFNSDGTSQADAQTATGFTLEEQIYVKRGEMVVRANETPPHVSSRIKVNMFWLGRDPMDKNKEYQLKLGTAKIVAKLENIERVINASNLSSQENCTQVQRHEVAECTLKLNQALAFDTMQANAATSRFVIVDQYNICGGGIVTEALEDKQAWVRDKVFERNFKWIQSNISREDRAERYAQKSVLVLVTGQKEKNRKEIARRLEEQFFQEGKFVYFLAIGSLIYGVDADIKNMDREETHVEHLRRLSEVSNILLDTGVILIITAIELSQPDKEIIKTAIDPEKIVTIWVGDQETTDISYDLKLGDELKIDDAAQNVKSLLSEKGFLFKSTPNDQT